MINIVLSLAGENLGNDIVLIDNIITNEKKYSIDIRTTLNNEHLLGGYIKIGAMS